MDFMVTRWHGAIVDDCERILGRSLEDSEKRFITSREGLVALEMIHDHVKSLSGDAAELRRYLNSEAGRDGK